MTIKLYVYIIMNMSGWRDSISGKCPRNAVILDFAAGKVESSFEAPKSHYSFLAYKSISHFPPINGSVIERIIVAL